MKNILIVLGLAVLYSCGSSQKSSGSNGSDTPKIKEDKIVSYAETITSSELKEYLYTFASDDFEGRDTGEPGQKKAADFLKKQYQQMNIASPLGEDDYYQEIPESYFRGGIKSSENVLAYIKGTEKPEEIVVLSAHYDHVGVDSNGNVYNGADDDGSGTVSILEIAQAFAKAAKDGNGPKRSVFKLKYRYDWSY